MGNSLDKSMDIGAIKTPVQLKTIGILYSKTQGMKVACFQPSWECQKDG
ncbi:MAG: hypothetical protein IPL08_18055 [Saprospiraceae bacterium]|nr:hypothetical protein [Saprospiraceae bacterium]